MEIRRSESVKPIERNRIGTFEIDKQILEDDENLGVLAELFSGMVILRADTGMIADRFGEVVKYVAISRHFQPVEKGAVIPDYKAIVEVIDNKVQSIKWECGIVKRFQERMKSSREEAACEEAQPAFYGQTASKMTATQQAISAQFKVMMDAGYPPSVISEFINHASAVEREEERKKAEHMAKLRESMVSRKPQFGGI